MQCGTKVILTSRARAVFVEDFFIGFLVFEVLMRRLSSDVVLLDLVIRFTLLINLGEALRVTSTVFLVFPKTL